VNALLLHDVEVDSRRVDVLVAGGRVNAVAASLPAPPGADRVDGLGGALLPGLHDHHVHLLAVAAAARSIDVSVLDAAEFATTVRAADRREPSGQWLRVVGYHDAVHGELDRETLDALVPGRPVRVQHATGALWVFNSAGARTVDLGAAPSDRVEPGAGRAYGLDDWLYHRLPGEPPDLVPVSTRLARYGITGVTDATPYRDEHDLDHLRAAVESGALLQRVVVTGAPTMPRTGLGPLLAGPAKVIVDDRVPPSIDDLAGDIAGAHDAGRAVAFHCASRLAIVLTIAALEQAGAHPGDRIEHAAVVPPELFARLRALGVTVVTQPAFVRERGDRYLAEVDAADVPHLWRCGSLLAAGIPVGFGSDAPHGPLDPWVAIAAATARRTRGGRELGTDERVDAATALGRFLTPWTDPGGKARRVEAGAPADLCLLHIPLADALRAPDAGAVRLTVVEGAMVSADATSGGCPT
jgi:predicted amidohydrolase YtcJ